VEKNRVRPAGIAFMIEIRQKRRARMSKRPLLLGELLVSSGLISEAGLAEVLEAQKADRRRLGDLLAERGLVRPRQIAQMLSYQLSCPWVSLTNMDIPRTLIELFPRELALKHAVVPVHLRETERGNVLHLAMYDPTDQNALAECANAVGMNVRPMVAITFEIRQALARFYGAPAPSLRGMDPPQSKPVVREAPVLAAAAAAPPLPRPASAAPAAAASELAIASEIPPSRRSEPPDSERAPLSRPPVVLVVNVPESFHKQCELAAAAVGGVIQDGSLLSAAEKVKAQRPVAIVVTDDIYSFDRSGLNRLAIESDALLVVWGEDVEARQLEPLFQGAVKRWRRSLS
jgi:hypothetical protein